MEPLAYRMRPTTLDEVLGQKHLIGENKILRKCVENKRLFSMIFLDLLVVEKQRWLVF